MYICVLRSNSQNIKHLKVSSTVTFIMVCNHPLYLVLEHFHHLERKPCTLYCVCFRGLRQQSTTNYDGLEQQSGAPKSMCLHDWAPSKTLLVFD